MMHWHIFNTGIFSGDFADFDEVEDVYNSIMAVVCVLCAGTAAGLTVGLLSLDITKLEIKIMTGSNDEKKAAQRILPVVKQHHLLLVTLLLFNALANETLPVFLGALMPNYLAVIVSVTLVLIFGEILPSAFFTGSQQLITAAKFTPVVYILFALFYPISFPISKLLDYWFGEDDDNGNISRRELEALVILQGDDHKKLMRSQTLRPSLDDNDSHSAFEEGLSAHEVQLMTGILKLCFDSYRKGLHDIVKYKAEQQGIERYFGERVFQNTCLPSPQPSPYCGIYACERANCGKFLFHKG
jgi:hypothetical protein